MQMDLKHDVVSLTDFARNTRQHAEDLALGGRARILTQNGKVVGSDGQVCTWTNTSKKQLQCVWTLSLFVRGQVVLTGLINFNKASNTLAVTGGTGTLSNVRGFATVANFSQKTNTITLHLTP